VDEYCFSRNVAKFGLKTCGIIREGKQEILHLDVNTTGGDKEVLLKEARQYLKECEVTKWAWES